ncbi:Papilin [Gryllus bimaculatus]|nr:Papilin [Gryllus bimaculatus]
MASARRRRHLGFNPCSAVAATLLLLAAVAAADVSAAPDGCEQVQREAQQRARALGAEEGAAVRVPRCTPKGDFEKVQCDAAPSPACWCVDAAGFEVPGTRAPARALVNCSDPKPCGSHTCRMLCPHGFALYDDGCPKCECRDPCADVKCPGKLSCQLEDVACAKQPCPPIPKCKRARSLENVCPTGEPLMISGSPRPFLCGVSAGKPQCPPMFQCLVQSGNDYGVCCPASMLLQKPGKCPAPSTDSDNSQTVCGSSCEHDLDCPTMQKCCPSDKCGKFCSQPQNVTECLQQQMLAELLIVNEREGKGYIPQCDPESGQFEAKQCSRNGLVCWCVDVLGNKVPGSMGPGDKVSCTARAEGRGVGRSLSCDRNICAQMCQYGFKVGADGCPTCECDNPCEGFECLPGEECVAVKDGDCSGTLCSTMPFCRPRASYINPCHMGTPLDDPNSGDMVWCRDGKFPALSTTCPKSHECTEISGVDAAVCCPRREPVEPTKLGLCPFLRLDNCKNVTLCETDNECEGDMKCCYAGPCGAVCADALLPTPTPSPPADEHTITLELEVGTSDRSSQTMCEYLRDFSDKMEGTREGMALALRSPVCYNNGSFNATQCSQNKEEPEECWCVDEFGTEIPKTRSTNVTNCPALREELECLGLTCRLGCDYGFVMDVETQCPRCECRNPCEEVQCMNGEECQMVEVSCDDIYCPPVPACLPKKPGQCPYLVPITSGSCDYECRGDQACNGTAKCCSNGCGTQCIEPVMMTACQHQRAILQHKAHESGIPAKEMYMPECRPADGGFEPVQCHPLSRQCWCVDEAGQEMPGTRAPPDVQPSCLAPNECPLLKCQPCEHGYKLDENGCQTCECRDPCGEISCRGDGEACRLVEVACVDKPCPPVPMCLPRRDNPCITGHPLLLKGSSDVLQCGPKGSSCPSSHKCHLSPLGEFAVCCPKPRDVCFEPKDDGSCNATPVPRWFFNPVKNKCEEFIFGGCGGNQNNFETEKICNTVCPVLSQCERLREKNLKAAEKYKKSTFLPRCDTETGLWEPIQCLDHVGVCWCVNRAGEPVKGSLTRGQPTCSSRQGRKRMHVSQSDGEMTAVIEELLKEVALLAGSDESASNDTPEPLLSRCQALHHRTMGSGAEYVVECDSDGRFTPIQCYTRVSNKFPECWCVDEAGNQLPNTTTFRRVPTPIKDINVTLGFYGHYDTSSKDQMESELRYILKKLGAKLKNDDMDIVISQEKMLMFFKLVGSNKVDVAYHLEEMVKSKRLKLDIGDGILASADITVSRFSNNLADEKSNEIAVLDRVIALEHREVVSQSTVSEVTPYQTAIIILAVSSAFVICILVVLIALYRRKMLISAGGIGSGNKGSNIDKHFLSQNTPIYVVSLPAKSESFPRVGLSSTENHYESSKPLNVQGDKVEIAEKTTECERL